MNSNTNINYNDQHQHQDQRRNKKKKHYRSRSRSKSQHNHKKRKHSRSRSQKKKDKKKKDKSQRQRQYDSFKKKSHQKQRDKDKSREREKQRQKQKQKQREKQRQRQLKFGISPFFKKQSQIHKQRQKNRNDSKQQHRDYDRTKQYKKDHKQKQKDSQSKQKQKYKQFEKNKSKRYQRDDQRIQRDKKQRDRNTKYDKYQRYDRFQKDQKKDRKDKQRQRQRFRSKSKQDQKRQRQRARSNQRKKDDKYRNRSKSRDQKRKDRRNRYDAPRFRFDSPPKSDQSYMSDDPQKMEKLNRMKAEKQLVTSKADRKLYLGNLPPNITSQQLMDMLNAALKKMEINTEVQGDSIISAWISPDGVGHYAFVQFRTAQQATNGLTLNGASLFGYQLKLGRPKQYIEYNKQLLNEYGNDSNIDTIIKKVQAIGGEVQYFVQQKIICPPTRIIILKHIVTVQQLAIDQQYQQILQDVTQMSKRFGDVIKVVIPRPHQVIDLQSVQTRVKGLGYIFIQYKTVDQATFARKQFIQKQFSNRSVACSFFDQKRFKEQEYDINQKVTIEF